MQIIFAGILITTIAVYGIFQGLNVRKYSEFFSPLDKKEYSYKVFLPGCLGIVEAIKLSGAGRYQARLNQKIVMLHGSRYLAYYTKVHWSSKVFHLILGLLVSAFFCLAGEAGVNSLIIIPGAAIGMFFLADRNLEEQYQKRRFKLERDFPDFVSKLVLLVSAGLNVRQAVERIVNETQKDEPLYVELHSLILDIQAGVPEGEAYSDFAERCKLKQITNFVSIIQQNAKLGGNQMLFELRRMGTECWELRKNVAKQLGETASSKLMIPLAIMFLAVVLICVAPVILELGSVF